ncbi:MAG: chromosomal replication initiator protein DnaA [Candidatus Hydrogenedens sp.]|nr:chromosomal replication initiator protein DnaA [Candidatus Hydrogenedens sp.]
MPPHKEANVWDLAQQHLQEQLDDYSYKNWFQPTRYKSFENGRLTIGVPNQFFADWLRDHYMDAVCSTLQTLVPEFQTVAFVPASEAKDAHEQDGLPAVASRGNGNGRHHADGNGHDNGGAASTAARRRPVKSTGSFNRRYTFDSFVIGSGNRFAHAAAKAVAESPGRSYNPLFLYGDTGLGKTHLMQAIGNALIQRRPDINCVFISSEHFTNQLIQSIAEKSTQRFRAKYRKVDVLLIDDIHFIAGKEATQEEFFHTFNELFDHHKQIVISSDRPPKEIKQIEERLVSRFEWGLVTDIQPPDLETRIAILQNKAQRENLTVSSEVLRYIATYITSNIRELEGALITVLAYSRLTENKISLQMVEEVLRDLIGTEKIKPVTVEQVQRAVAEYYDVRIADLCGRSKQRQVVRPRQIAMYLCKQLMPSMSLNDVGRAFGGKDHTTVLYACDQISGRAKEDLQFRQVLDMLSKSVRSS